MKKKEDQESPWVKTLFYGGLGAVGGVCFSELLGTPNDAVNYTQLDANGAMVYHGITGKHRVDKRMQEHIRSGKIFSDVEVSNPLPRVDARRIELELIKKLNRIFKDFTTIFRIVPFKD